MPALDASGYMVRAGYQRHIGSDAMSAAIDDLADPERF